IAAAHSGGRPVLGAFWRLKTTFSRIAAAIDRSPAAIGLHLIYEGFVSARFTRKVSDFSDLCTALHFMSPVTNCHQTVIIDA
ncbi:MAG: hypothetical protein AAAB19_23625, partial [Rhizobium sp.]